jgi:hypothetical protein
VSKLWRTVAVCTMAGSLLAAGGLPALAATRRAATPAATHSATPATQRAATPAATAAPATVTIAASSKPEVAGNALVVYRTKHRSTAAKISGSISGATGSNLVKLYAQPFPYRHQATAIATAMETTSYSFTVKPAIATRYYVTVETSPLVTSKPVTVYISSSSLVAVKRGCSTVPVCRPAYRLYLYLPATLIKRYIQKHWYVYVGLRLTAASNPPPGPKWLYLDKRATVSAPRRVTAQDYERTVSFPLRIGNDSATWTFLVCAKDAEATDGIGLPGRHSCGVHRVRANVSYLG